jgi:hypothetical protein
MPLLQNANANARTAMDTLVVGRMASCWATLIKTGIEIVDIGHAIMSLLATSHVTF